ncbi:cytochrome P450 [Mycena crocata]|nr:cytochrome P450 [Mycena crocata]
MDEHKRQVELTATQNPAFGVAQIRELTEIFNQKSAQLRDIWTKQIDSQPGSSRIDVLNVIGLAGFNYQFDALEPKGEPNELDLVLTELLRSPQSQKQAALRFLQASIPILNIIPSGSQPTFGASKVHEARRKMVKIGNQLLADSKAAVKGGGDVPAAKRDLLSIMVKANMSDDIPDSQRLSDTDVIAQVPTFFVAGHETTSTATAWALYSLATHPAVQQKLRQELLTVPGDNPIMDELNSLPYLENVVRETMRVHAPVSFTIRVAMEDDILPLSKPYMDTKGKVQSATHHGVGSVVHPHLLVLRRHRVPKGTTIRIPIAAVNCDKEIWGEDAFEFRPDRWENLPEAADAIPGVWANLLTILAGPHNCIGFRFSIVEMKSLLFTLARAFEFEMALPDGEIVSTSTPVLRPKVRSEPEGGSQLPLNVRPCGA